MTNHRFRMALYVLCFAAPSVLAQPVNVASVQELVKQWNAGQHLYVKGNLGIGETQLNQLESWLDENASHWTVALFEQAGDETYLALDGRRFQGMDAVEYALGRGLALRTNFSDLVDERTGETNGAVFVLFLQERKFSYYASVAQDGRGLGESRWVGELDRPAFRAMRGGGRILDAVKDTIRHIDERLDNKITAELAQAEREAQARQRMLVHLQTDLKGLETTIQQVEKQAADLRQELPDAKGPLASPPLRDWRVQLADIDAQLESRKLQDSSQAFQSLSTQVEGYLTAFAHHAAIEQSIAPIQKRIDALRDHEITSGRAKAEEAERHIATARAAHQNGDSNLAEPLDQARQALAAGEQAVQDTADALARDAARRAVARKAALATAAVFVVAFFAVLVWLNRRRVPALKRAREELAKRRSQVKAEMENVYELFEWSHEILGSEERVEKRGYEGTTKEFVNTAFADVDDLFVMSSEVERVMQEARDIVEPTQWISRLVNLFSQSRYEQGINRVSGEPLTFDQQKGLPLVIQRQSEETGQTLPEQVTMTFDQVFDAFRERTQAAKSTLETIEQSLLRADDELSALQQRIQDAIDIDQRLEEASEDDGLFPLPAFFDVLIPSAQSDHDEADQLIAADPVQVMQRQIPQGRRKLEEGISVAASVDHARATVLPKLNRCAPELLEAGFQTEWMHECVEELGRTANQVLVEAAKASVSDEAESLAHDLDHLGLRAEETLKLVKELARDEAPLLDELRSGIGEARHEIGDRLSREANDCLREAHAVPDVHCDAANEFLAGARAALQLGDVQAAKIAQKSLHAEVDQAQTIVDESLSILNDFGSNHRTEDEAWRRVADRLPPHEALHAELREQFASSAWLLQASDPSHSDGTATVESLLASGKSQLAAMKSQLEEASTLFSEARLLRANHRLLDAANVIKQVDQSIDDVATHCEKLRDVSRENESALAAAKTRLRAIEGRLSDSRTTQSTVRAGQQLAEVVDLTSSQIREMPPRDPFADQRTIHQLAEQLSELDARVSNDFEAHAEAKRAVDGLHEEQRRAEELVQRARHDGIPDSQATKSGIHAIHGFQRRLSDIERDLDRAHGDWAAIHTAADRLHSEIGLEAGKLRGELDQAQKMMALFEAASHAVLDANRWSGSYGIRVHGTPGSTELDRARRALNHGDYSAMASLAQAAQMAAQQAIRKAQREVERRQREEARRAEEARRRRQRQQTSSMTSRSTSFSSSSSRSSSSSSSSSGSGFSRSGW